MKFLFFLSGFLGSFVGICLILASFNPEAGPKITLLGALMTGGGLYCLKESTEL